MLRYKIEEQIKNKALEIGFDLVGISSIDNSGAYYHYERWLSRGFHGYMQYMERNKEDRRGLSFARSVISLGLNYYNSPNNNKEANISIYAQNKDYHIILTKMMKVLINFIKQIHTSAKLKYYVDTGPLLEKAYAEKSGLGWIAKNTCLINKRFGSFVFLCEILTDIELKEDTKSINYCGKCQKCIDECPTNALTKPYTLDSRLCIAYLNIELKDHIPKELRSKIGNNLFGCDICQTVCPWNKRAKQSKKIELLPRKNIEEKNLTDFLSIEEDEFRLLFKQNPIKRLKWRYFLRNAIIVAANLLKPKYLTQLTKLLKLNDSLLNEHIIWAINKIRKNKQH